MEPFTIQVPDEVLTDLQERLERTRWPEPARAKEPWALGTDLTFMRSVLDYWRNEYDWREVEARLNALDHFHTYVDGLKIHFIVEEGSGGNPMPLILTHGWPGSFVEFVELVEPLAHPERFGGDAQDAFTVIVPSLPGYAFSDAPDAPIPPREVARLWHMLMTRNLGFERFAAHGSDWGDAITGWLGADYPGSLIGIHLVAGILTPPDAAGRAPLTEQEQAMFARRSTRMSGESGYQAIQGTKPQTLSIALADSPAGLAAWILEKFHGWTQEVHGAPSLIPMEPLITNIMLYWLSRFHASAWLYAYLVDGTAFVLEEGQRIEVPAGFCLFPDDIGANAPQSWLKRTYDVRQYEIAERGGHFPGLEVGDILMNSIRRHFRQLR